MNRLLIFTISMFLISAYSVFAAASEEYMANEILARMKATNSISENREVLRRNGVSILEKIELGKLRQGGELLRLKIASGETVERAVARLSAEDAFEVVEPNFIYHTSVTPNDTHQSYLWGSANTAQSIAFTTIATFAGPTVTRSEGNPGLSGIDMKLRTAWDKITDCSSVIVAIVDSGVQYNHEDLASNMWMSGIGTLGNHGYDFVNNDNDPMDDNGHGTHVAGTVGARGNNGKGVTGVCWNASIMAVKTMNDQGSGSNSNIVKGISFAVSNGAKVINLSLGGTAASSILSTAIQSAGSNNVVVVSAAGNSNLNNDVTPSYPCNYAPANSICVGAIAQNGARASFSNYGLSSVDLAAPGVNILSTWHDSRTTIPVDINTGWAGSSNTGSAFGTLAVNGTASISFPSNWNGSNQYLNSTDAKISTTLNLAAYTESWIKFSGSTSFGTGDFMRVMANSGTMDVFTSSGTLMTMSTTISGFSATVPIEDNCLKANCNIGFRAITDGAGVSSGIRLHTMSAIGFSNGTTGYNFLAGTSMATPQVAGVAAMIRAYNPALSAADVVRALKGGGVAISGLESVFKTGKSLNAPGALAFLQAPTGVTAQQVP